MPVLEYPQGGLTAQVFIDQTEFENPDKTNEKVKIRLYLAGAKFDDAKLRADYKDKDDKFFESLKQFVSQIDRKVLETQCSGSNGVFKFTLDGTDVALKRGQHFWLDARDKLGM